MSTLKLYKHTGLELGKHFIIENMENYLNQFEVVSISNFQYLKISLLMTIKVDMSQTLLAPRSAFDYDYLSIINPNESIMPWNHVIYYFFIVNKTWKSESTIELSLSLDTLNTYRWNTHYIVDKKTLVKREHKDRIRALDSSNKPNFGRIVDLRSEDVNAPVYKTQENKVLMSDKSDLSWILYYRNKNPISSTDYDGELANNPIECFLAPSKPVNARYSSNNATISSSSFVNDGYYYIKANQQFSINGVIYPTSSLYDFEIRKTSSGLTIKKCNIVERFQQPDEWFDAYEKETLVSNAPSFDVIEPNVTELSFRFFSNEQSVPPVNTGTLVQISVSSTTITFVLTPESIDRSDSRNIKIIEIPYPPTNITYDEDDELYIFDNSWKYDATQKLFKLVSLDAKFGYNFKTSSNPLANTIIENDMYEDISADNLREDIFESKIYHSDFYRPKYVYDSFSLTFQYELFGANYDVQSISGLFDINFVMSRNVVSKFLFKFPQYTPQYAMTDFENILAISRNNEQVIYNSTYLNYIRNGYNYDLKSKNRSESVGAFNLGASVLGTLVGLIGSVATGNYGMALVSGVGGAIGIATASVNYAKNVAQSEQNIQQKLDESMRQSVTIQNADDIDLLNAYCDNKLKYCVYEVSPTMKQALLDMFYYCGYATQEQKVPQTATRYWFNFIQCDLVVEHTSNLPSPIMDDIKAKFSEGCTFFHEHSGEWDVEQTKENYESWILE